MEGWSFPYKTALASIQGPLKDTLYGRIVFVYLCLGVHVSPLVDEDFSHIHSVFLSSQMEWGQATLQESKDSHFIGGDAGHRGVYEKHFINSRRKSLEFLC